MRRSIFLPRKRSRNENATGPKFLGLEIDTKTNLISLVAFLLSVTGIIGQIYFFLQGPRVALQPPEQVVFYSDLSADGATSYVKIAARMAYVNTGQAGFNDAVKKEAATLIVANRPHYFYWKKYISSDSEGAKFIANKKGDALPVPVNAGSVEAHETSFSPLPNPLDDKRYAENFIEFSKFKEEAGAEKEVTILFSYETFSGGRGEVKCVVPINDAFRSYIQNGWIAPGCR